MDVRNMPAPMKRVVHLGTRSYGRLTAPSRMSWSPCRSRNSRVASAASVVSAHTAASWARCSVTVVAVTDASRSSASRSGSAPS